MNSPPSLENLILSHLTLEEVEAISFQPTHPLFMLLAHSSDWDLWRVRAQILHQVPPAFFDLPRSLPGLPKREISGFQRYLEVSEERMGLTFYEESGLVEGIYEARAGLDEALSRDDPQLLEYFYTRLAPDSLKGIKTCSSGKALAKLEQLSSLSFPCPKLRLNGIERLLEDISQGQSPALEIALSQLEVKDLNFLRAVLKSGRKDFFDFIIPSFVPGLPEDFSLDRDVPFQPFQVVGPGWWRETSLTNPFPFLDWLVKLPQRLVNSWEEEEEIFEAALYGGSSQVVDFFRSYFHRNFSNSLAALLEGYSRHRRRVEAYSLLQRYAREVDDLFYLHLQMEVDFFLYLFSDSLQQDELTLLSQALYMNMGNMPLLLALRDLLPIISQEDQEYVREMLEEQLGLKRTAHDLIDISPYPLTGALFWDILRFCQSIEEVRE